MVNSDFPDDSRTKVDNTLTLLYVFICSDEDITLMSPRDVAYTGLYDGLEYGTYAEYKRISFNIRNLIGKTYLNIRDVIFID